MGAAHNIDPAEWLAAEPDDDIRSELADLMATDPAEVARRFAEPLQFGTAGLRAAVGAGRNRMNRLVVRAAAAGVADYVLATVVGAAESGIVVARDARRKSDLFAADTAAVCAARGLRVWWIDGAVPTPVLAHTVAATGAAAGVMVTASHNPPEDNGYKVYLAGGAQIVAPVDAAIAEAIAAIDPTCVPMASLNDPLITDVPADVLSAYIERVAGVRHRLDVDAVPVAYTALHGVGGDTVCAVFERASLGRPHVVTSQFSPDSTFPTVAFPNPEEPGAMDAVIDLARTTGCTIAIANDPDADRLGVAIPTGEGEWRRLAGDEIGWLLADHVLAHTTGDDRLVVTTVVSSGLLARMASAYGVHHAETLTGFKWIARAITERPHLRAVFAYEQALGYLVCPAPPDKDGISAAVMMAEIAAVAASEGVTIADRLAVIADRFGEHLLAERSVGTPVGHEAVAALVAHPPSTLGGQPVTDVAYLADAMLLRLSLAGGCRVQVRPSGTEPKVKIYAEGVGVDPGAAADEMALLLRAHS